MDHVGITVSSLDRALDFYCGRLGLTLIDRELVADADIADLVGYDGAELDCADLDSGDGRILELIEYRVPSGLPLHREGRQVGNVHVSLSVADIRAVLTQLEGTDASVISRRIVRFDAPGSPWHDVECVYVSDPDGVVVELVSRPPQH